MAEVIGLASGCVALAAFAIQSSTTLYSAITSFQTHSRRVKDLSDELEALSGVLKSLAGTIHAIADYDFSALNFPLLRCGNACKDFKKELDSCSARSSTKTSFRDWAKLRYMGDDIDGFRRLISSYKMTISIALTDANLRRSTATAESIQVYNNLLSSTRTDLEDQLQHINEKLDLLGDTLVVSQADADEVKAIKEERTSTEKCLEICAQLSEHISRVQLAELQRPATMGHSDDFTSPERIANRGLQECKENLATVMRKLEDHNKLLFNRLLNRTGIAATSAEEQSDLMRLRDEWEMNRQSMDICSRAYEHLRDNVSDINNYATGDAVQFLVSTSEKTIRGTNRGLGWRTRQIGGDIDPESFRQMMRSLEAMDAPIHMREQSEHNRETGVGSPDLGTQKPSFQSKYGKGFDLTSSSSNTLAHK